MSPIRERCVASSRCQSESPSARSDSAVTSLDDVCRRLVAEGHAKGEPTAFADHAFGGDLASHRRHQLADDRQSKPRSTAAAVARRVSTIEPLKNLLELVWWDSLASVLYGDAGEPVIMSVCADRHQATFWRVTNCVAHQVSQHLRHPLPISDDGGEARLHLT